MVVWGGDGGSSARAIDVRKVERKMERRVRRDRGGRGVGVSIADFFGEAAEEVNRVDAESSGIFINCPARYGLSVIARLSKTKLCHLHSPGSFLKLGVPFGPVPLGIFRAIALLLIASKITASSAPSGNLSVILTLPPAKSNRTASSGSVVASAVREMTKLDRWKAA